MCGRYALYGPQIRYRKTFGAEWIDDDFSEIRIPARFDVPEDVAFWDIRPTTIQPVVVGSNGSRCLAMFRWGLIPAWAKDPKAMNTLFNARLETAPIKPFFRKPFRSQRCIVPVDAFYEWKAVPGTKTKQRYLIAPTNDEPMGLAGLWDVWNAPEGPTPSFTILTTEPNELMSPIHDRMPVILKPENYAAWLDSGITEADQVLALCKPYPSEMMQAEIFTPPA